jgi:putative hydrolase of the HAD superfamily
MKIFLDIDGVLVTGFHAKPEFRKLWHEKICQDLGINRENFEKYVFSSDWLNVLEGRKDLKCLLDEALPHLNFKGNVHDIINYWFEKDSNLDNQLLGLLNQIKQKNKNIKFYIATNQEQNRADYLWNNLKLKDLFEDIFYSGKIGMVKRNPDFFHKINKQLALKDCKDVLFFDDHVHNVESAKLAGWNAFEYETIKDFVENPLIKELMV